MIAAYLKVTHTTGTAYFAIIEGKGDVENKFHLVSRPLMVALDDMMFNTMDKLSAYYLKKLEEGATMTITSEVI